MRKYHIFFIARYKNIDKMDSPAIATMINIIVKWVLYYIARGDIVCDTQRYGKFNRTIKNWKLGTFGFGNCSLFIDEMTMMN